jgi:hypothetical protein
MQEPQRKTVRTRHLDASIVHVERALLARAEIVGSQLDIVRRAARMNGIVDERLVSAIADMVAEIVHEEYRALAEELHWW